MPAPIVSVNPATGAARPSKSFKRLQAELGNDELLGRALNKCPAPHCADRVAEPAAAEPEALKAHTEEPTLLEGLGEKPAEPEAKPAAEAPAEAVVEAPTDPAAWVYDFKLPEGVEPAAEQISAYTDVLREHRIPPETGQKLLDLHTATIQRMAENTLADQHKAFADVRRQWREEVKGDPEIGGSGYETALRAIARARDAVVSESDRPAFDRFLRDTGAGDHPAFLRAMYRVANLLDEPPAPHPMPRPSPTANPTQRRGMAALFDRTMPNSFANGR